MTSQASGNRNLNNHLHLLTLHSLLSSYPFHVYPWHSAKILLSKFSKTPTTGNPMDTFFPWFVWLLLRIGPDCSICFPLGLLFSYEILVFLMYLWLFLLDLFQECWDPKCWCFSECFGSIAPLTPYAFPGNFICTQGFSYHLHETWDMGSDGVLSGWHGGFLWFLWFPPPWKAPKCIHPTRSLSHRRFCWPIPYPTNISSLKMPLKCIPLSLFLERVSVLVLVIYFCLDPSLLPVRLCSQSRLPCCTWREFPQT